MLIENKEKSRMVSNIGVGFVVVDYMQFGGHLAKFKTGVTLRW